MTDDNRKEIKGREIEIRYRNGGDYGLNGWYWDFADAPRRSDTKRLHATKELARHEAMCALESP